MADKDDVDPDLEELGDENDASEAAPPDGTEESSNAPPEDDEFPDPDDFDFGDDFDEDDEAEDDEASRAKRKKIVLIGGASTLAVILLAGLGLVLFAGGDDQSAHKDDPSRVSMELPPPSAVIRGKQSNNAGSSQAERPSLADRAAAMTPPAASPAPSVAAAAGAVTSATTAAAGAAPQGAAAARAPAAGAARGLVVPAVTAASFSSIPEVPRGEPLRPAPLQAMVEAGPNGQLPTLSPQGRRSWEVYSSPSKADPTKPKIAVVVRGLGLARASTLAAIEQLPASVTLVFDPYARNMGDWASLARGAGHEIMIGLPMEPVNFPVFDPGPYALLTDLDTTENLERLYSVMGLAPGYVGLMAQMGSRFSTSDDALTPMIDTINKRGLFIFETSRLPQSRIAAVAAQVGAPHLMADLELDSEPSRTAIPAKFTELEAKARQAGQAIAVAEPLPISVRLIAEWSLNLPQRNIELVPLTALVRQPPPPGGDGSGTPTSR